MRYNATLPARTNTLLARTLAKLLTGDKLAHKATEDATGSYRLAAQVNQLQNKYGFVFEKNQLTEDSRDPLGRHAVYTIYWLPQALLDWLGGTGENFVEKVLSWEEKRIKEREAATSQSEQCICYPQVPCKPNCNTQACRCQRG